MCTGSRRVSHSKYAGLIPVCIQKYDPQAGAPGDQEDATEAHSWCVGVVPTQHPLTWVPGKKGTRVQTRVYE